MTMGNKPPMKCRECNYSIPDCSSDPGGRRWIDGRIVHASYGGGRLYLVGEQYLLCRSCFHRPKREREARERRERERREQQRQKEEAERRKRQEEARKRREQQEKEDAERKRREQNQLEGERKSKALLTGYQNSNINKEISSSYHENSVVVKYYTGLQDGIASYSAHDILPIDSELFYYLLCNGKKISCENDMFKLSGDENSRSELLLRFFPNTAFTNDGAESMFNIQFITPERIAWVGLDKDEMNLLPVSSPYEAITVTVVPDSQESVNMVCKTSSKMINIGSNSALALVNSPHVASFRLKIATDSMCSSMINTPVGPTDGISQDYPDVVQILTSLPYGSRIEDIPQDLKKFVACVSDLLVSSWEVCPPPQDYLDWLLSVLLDLYIRVEVGERELVDGVSQTLANIIDANLEQKQHISILAAMCRLCSPSTNLRPSSSFDSKDQKVFDDKDDQIQRYLLKFLDDIINASQGVESVWLSKCVKVYVKEIFGNSVETRAVFENFFDNLFHSQLWPAVDIWSFAKMIKRKLPDDNDTLLLSLSIVLSYQIRDHERVLEIFKTYNGDKVLEELHKIVKQEKDKDVDEVLQEIVRSGELQTEICDRLRSIILSVSDMLGKFGYPLKKCTPIESWGDLKTKVENTPIKDCGGGMSMSPFDQDLTKTLVIMACSVNKFKGYWPRVTQLTSWILLAISTDKGRLLEISTGEGKSCVVAMFAAMLANQGKHVDIITSSSVLADRDAVEWRDFYTFFNVTVGSNINVKDDDDRRRCYNHQIVFGTVASFAADILRQDFQQQQIRGQRSYDSVIVDEVDFMLLDRGVQFTYLSQQVAGMRHLDPVLAMIWNLVSPFTAVELETGTTLFKGYPQPFYRAIFDFVDEITLEEVNFSGSLQEFLFLTLQQAESRGILKDGFTDKAMNVDSSDVKELETILRNVTKEEIGKFLNLVGELLGVNFIPYLSPDGISMKKMNNEDGSSHEFEIPIYVVGEGMCCNLLDNFDEIAEAIEDNVLSHVSYGETKDEEESTLLPLPQNLEPLITSRLMAWIANAFEATRMTEGRQYLVQDGNILPIDFRSTGMVELNKKWGDGLQQFLEMKHHLILSQMSLITNFMSNIAFFQKYKTNIFGVSGTLGSETDKKFLQKTYYTSLCSIPTHRTKKLFEVEGMLVESKQAWCEEVCQKLNFELKPKWGTRGRAALVICEDINIANEVSGKIRANVTSKVTLYTRNETQEARALDRTFDVGEVIVATNLAGRGTDIKLSDEVNVNGGMFVLLTFLPLNERVERQALGRTARKGKPGSAQMIILKDRLNPVLLQEPSDLQTITLARNKVEKIRMEYINQEVSEVLLKESLFSQYCNFLGEVRAEIVDKEEEVVTVEALNEKWGVWLKTQTERISKLRRDELRQQLEKDLQVAKEQCLRKKSPSRNIYHIIKFGNELVFDGKYKTAKKQFTDAIEMNPTWSSIAYYNRAYCVIRLKEEDYLQKAIDDLNCCVKQLENYSTEMYVVLSLLDNAKGSIRPIDETSRRYTDHVDIRENILKFYRENIGNAIGKLQEIKDQGRDALAKPTTVFSLVPDADHDTQQELYEFWQIGLLQVFSVEKKPRFCWEGLIVALIGALQIFAGACLTVVSCGTLTTIGTGLIGEGVSDVVEGISSTIQGGNFDWKAWGIGKAISVAASLIGAGVKKFFKKGVNMIRKISSKIDNFFGETKAILNMSPSVTKGPFETVSKKIVQEFTIQTVMFGIESAEQALLSNIMAKFKESLSKTIKSGVAKMVDRADMGSFIERIVLHVVKDPEYVTKSTQSNIVCILQDIFQTEILLPYSRNSELRHYIYSALSSVRNELKDLGNDSEFGKIIFHAIDIAIDSAEIGKAVVTITDLIKTFDEKMMGSLLKYCQDENIPSREGNVNVKMLETVVTEIKKDLADLITEEVTDFIVGMLEQTVSRTLVRRVKGKVNKHVSAYLSDSLGVKDTAEQLQAEAKARNIAYVPHTKQADASPMSKSHEYFPVRQYARKVENSDKPGTLLDARVLSESLGVKIKIMEEGKDGKLITKIETGGKTAHEQISILYRKPIGKYPEGHYDVIIAGKIVEVNSQKKNCLFHAIAKSRNPSASDEELNRMSVKYREETANELQRNYLKWNAFLKRQTITMKLHGGYEALAIGAGKDNVGEYRLLKKSNSSLNTVEHDHQPPCKCIWDAGQDKNASTLGKAMFKAAYEGSKNVTNLSESARAPHGVAVRIPKQDHRNYLQTKYKDIRGLITTAITEGNEVEVFKYIFVTSQTADVVSGSKKYSSEELSNRKEENREVVRQWINKLQIKEYRFDPNNINVINAWIDDGKFCDPNDDHFQIVSKILFARESKKAQSFS